VKHSKATADAFTAAGIPTVHVDADTTGAELQEACQGLASGKYLAMSNCELVIEGFDLSMQAAADVTLECCILLRPTESVARYLQMVFRSLRKKPKPAIILDHSGCALRHGFPDDDREWSLDGSETKQRKKNDDEVKAKQCNKCYAIFRPGPSHCPTCGESLTGKERKIEVTDGELIEVDIEAMRREQKREQGSARTLPDLVALGLRRGQNRPAEWAANVMAARQGRKPTPGDYKAAREHQEKLKEVWGHA
jgi:superfamily II DNA or RNA helicase